MFASVMPRLPTPLPAPPKRKTIEHRLEELLTALLRGTNETTYSGILRRLMIPKVRRRCFSAQRVHGRNQSFEALNPLYFGKAASISATPGGVPVSSSGLDDYLIERARRAWSKESTSTAMWDARKASYFLVKSIKGWAMNGSAANSEIVFKEIAGPLKDVLTEMEDRMEDRDGAAGDFEDIVTGGAIGRPHSGACIAHSNVPVWYSALQSHSVLIFSL